MNIPIVVFIIISLSANAEEETKEENRDTQDEYTSIELAAPNNSDVTEEETSTPDRYDGIVDIDDIIRSSEFNNMFYPETTQVRRFALPLKDYTSDDLYKAAKLSKNASGEKDKSAKEEKKSAKEMDKSAKKEEKSAKKEEKSGKNQDKNGMEEDKSVKEKDKSGNEDNKNVEEQSKTAEDNNKSGEEKERRAADKDKSALPVEEDKSGVSDIIDVKASRMDDKTQEKAEETSKRSLTMANEFPDDMDDLIAPYLLEKFRNSYDDDNYDRSQYAANHEERYDEDLLEDDASNPNNRPNRRMFDSAPIPDLDKEKSQLPTPIFDTFSTPKPFMGNRMRPPQVYQPMMRPPFPYVNNINQLPYSNIRLPLQNPVLNNINLNNLQQLPFPRQNLNRLGQVRDLKANSNKYNDANEYPYNPPLPTSRRSQPSINPIFSKLTQASNNPRQLPFLVNFKLPTRPVTTPYQLYPRVNVPPNYDPYIFRYK